MMVKVIHKPSGKEQILNQTHAKRLIDYSDKHNRGWELVKEEESVESVNIGASTATDDRQVVKPSKKMSKEKKNENTVTEGSISNPEQ